MTIKCIAYTIYSLTPADKLHLKYVLEPVYWCSIWKFICDYSFSFGMVLSNCFDKEAREEEKRYIMSAQCSRLISVRILYGWCYAQTSVLEKHHQFAIFFIIMKLKMICKIQPFEREKNHLKLIYIWILIFNFSNAMNE